MSELKVIEQEQQQSDNVLTVISRAAVDPKVDIDKMERLLVMQESIMDRQARSSFNRDMAKLQAEMPTIAKDGKIMVRDECRSTYAKFEDIVAATKPLLSKYGFSITFASDIDNSVLTVTGTISHREGHSETTSLPLPFDSSGAKNSVQAIGSSISYGKRYVFGMLTNVVTGNDDDGQAADPENTLDKMLERLMLHNEILRDTIQSVLVIKESIACDDLSTAKEAWSELSEIEQRSLWVATTKGGIFTTSERKTIKSNEWNAA